jgi:hypothetical protein
MTSDTIDLATSETRLASEEDTAPVAAYRKSGLHTAIASASLGTWSTRYRDSAGESTEAQSSAATERLQVVPIGSWAVPTDLQQGLQATFNDVSTKIRGVVFSSLIR